MLTLVAESEQDQEAVGAALARSIRSSCIVYLEGDLGSGKTTLVRGFIHELGHQGAVKSPTYTLVEPYEFGGRHIYHFDLYRLGDADELEYLGIRDMLQADSVLLVEWPERGEGGLPQADLRIRISYQGSGRRLEVSADGSAGNLIIQQLARELRQKVNPDNNK
jgi:tRNA threonylcarbamoyladenosine biosynthesis protein TsaE